MSVQTYHAETYNDIKGLGELKHLASQSPDKALEEAARQFEAIMIKQLLKQARDAKLDDGMLDSNQTKFYEDMYDQQLSLEMTKGRGLGLADMLVKQLGGTPASERAQTENRITPETQSSSTPVTNPAIATAASYQPSANRTVSQPDSAE